MSRCLRCHESEATICATCKMQRVVQARYEAKKAVFDEIDDKLFAVNDDDIWKVLADIRKKHLRD